MPWVGYGKLDDVVEGRGGEATGGWLAACMHEMANKPAPVLAAVAAAS